MVKFAVVVEEGVPQLGVIERLGRACAVEEEVRYVYEQTAECDSDKQQRLELFSDSEVEKNA